MSKFSIYLASIFLGLLVVTSLLGYIPNFLTVTYFAISLITFLVYYLDKSKAKRNAWRTPESTLHLLALFGGWPGAAIAQQSLRHKTQKKTFRVVFWLTVVINCGIIVWLMWSNVLM